jgi:hypothetical protein
MQIPMQVNDLVQAKSRDSLQIAIRREGESPSENENKLTYAPYSLSGSYTW